MAGRPRRSPRASVATPRIEAANPRATAAVPSTALISGDRRRQPFGVLGHVRLGVLDHDAVAGVGVQDAERREVPGEDVAGVGHCETPVLAPPVPAPATLAPPVPAPATASA